MNINPKLIPEKYNYSSTIPVVSGNISTGSWQNVNTKAEETPTLEAGTYLVLYSVPFYSSASGDVVTRVILDGDTFANIQSRIATTIHSGYTTYANVSFTVNFATKGTHTIRFQAYSSAQASFPSDTPFTFIKL